MEGFNWTDSMMMIPNATELPPPELLMPVEAALMIGVAVFGVFLALGIIVLASVRCACPTGPDIEIPDTSGCRGMLPCRACSVLGLWCYVKCCHRQKRYMGRVTERAGRLIDDMEGELNIELENIDLLLPEQLEDDDPVAGAPTSSHSPLDSEMRTWTHVDTTVAKPPPTKRD